MIQEFLFLGDLHVWISQKLPIFHFLFRRIWETAAGPFERCYLVSSKPAICKYSSTRFRLWWWLVSWGTSSCRRLWAHTLNSQQWHKCLRAILRILSGMVLVWGVFLCLSQCDFPACCHWTARKANCHGYREYPCWETQEFIFLPTSTTAKKIQRLNSFSVHMLNIWRRPFFQWIDCLFICCSFFIKLSVFLLKPCNVNSTRRRTASPLRQPGDDGKQCPSTTERETCILNTNCYHYSYNITGNYW